MALFLQAPIELLPGMLVARSFPPRQPSFCWLYLERLVSRFSGHLKLLHWFFLEIPPCYNSRCVKVS